MKFVFKSFPGNAVASFTKVATFNFSNGIVSVYLVFWFFDTLPSVNYKVTILVSGEFHTDSLRI